MWFGVFYLILQLIPPFSMLFLLTSAAGSALWSVHIEREGAEQQNIEQLQEGDEEEDLPPAYSDEA